ncbi:MAG: hypothetical protein HY275_09660 [Gemmatimonadetes bacterium]|nr:hypothetical protein [Gemmatimonadota bacterium]
MLTALVLTAQVLLQGEVRPAPPASTDRPPAGQPVAVSVVRDSGRFASAGLEALVRRAQVSNRRVPAGIERYTAQIESEIGLILNSPVATAGAVAGTAAATQEQAGQVEQVQSTGRWQRDGAYEQHIIGYRSQMLGPSISALSFLRGAWTAPTLYGNRLAFFFGGFGARDSTGRDSIARRDSSLRGATRDSTRRIAVHPFAVDGPRYYRYSGGDTSATMMVAGRLVTVVHVVVEPVADAPGEALLFGGELFVDAARAEIIRMRGRLYSEQQGSGARAPLAIRVLQAASRLRGIAYVDYENAEVNGRYWLPRRQRLEMQAVTSLTETRPLIRIISQWRELDVTENPEAGRDSADSLRLTRYRLTTASADSVRLWSDWRRAIGEETRSVGARDFDDVAPPDLRADGPPQVVFQARRFSDLVRFNRVEGLYTGVAGTLQFRDAAPGLTLRGIAGWAWSAQAPKGGLEAAYVRGPWISSLRAERYVASTSDFAPFMGGGEQAIGGLFGRDDADWVDRRVALLGLSRELGRGHNAAFRVEAGAGEDAPTPRVVLRGPFAGQDFRDNRPLNAGSYWLTTASLELGRNGGTATAQGGTRATLQWQSGFGALHWNRAQARLEHRRWLGDFLFVQRADAVWLFGDGAPLQQLVEAGGVEGLPGYAYKEFTGDKGVMARSTVGYQLPFWNAPLRFWGLIFPAVAPMPTVGVYGGRVGASLATRAQMAPYGYVPTEGWRATMDARLRFFGGAVSIGASRAIDRPDPWKLLIALGGVL